jgi:hypothetical protein
MERQTPHGVVRSIGGGLDRAGSVACRLRLNATYAGFSRFSQVVASEARCDIPRVSGAKLVVTQAACGKSNTGSGGRPMVARSSSHFGLGVPSSKYTGNSRHGVGRFS